MLMMLYDFGMNLAEEKVLFEDGRSADLTCAGAAFRRAGPEDDANGGWIVEVDGAVVGAGGVLGHYNPPYGDVYVGVDEAARRRGVGSFLVQELKRVCYESGMKPAARCDPSNLASRRTLERAGFRVCGRLLAAEVAPLD
jgi:GNAT superfamily N-acetyltransferase